MRSADQPLAWTDGPRNRGCSYHKCARFDLAGDTIQIDVFVISAIAARRPIAVTVGWYRDYQSVQKHQHSIGSVQEADLLLFEISASFEKLGCPQELSVYRADEVADIVKS